MTRCLSSSTALKMVTKIKMRREEGWASWSRYGYCVGWGRAWLLLEGPANDKRVVEDL